MTIKPKVTKEDITVGKPRDSANYPDAIALSRACGQPMEISEELPHLLVFYPSAGNPLSIFVPDEIQQQIKDYDLGHSMTPHEWPPVEVPDDWVKGAKR